MDKIPTLDVEERAKEYADSLDEVITYRETPFGTILVMGIKEDRFVYMEFHSYNLRD